MSMRVFASLEKRHLAEQGKGYHVVLRGVTVPHVAIAMDEHDERESLGSGLQFSIDNDAV